MNHFASHHFRSRHFASNHLAGGASQSLAPPESMAAGNGGEGRRGVSLRKPRPRAAIRWTDDYVAIALVLAIADDF